MDAETFDHVIVGAGQATGVLVGGLSADATIAVIEGAEVGGTCVNTGCTPTKTLVASARVAHMARRAAEYGVETGEVGVDFGRVMERMNEVRHGSRDGLAEMLESTDNVTLIRGWARFEDAETLVVDERDGGERRVRGGTIHLDTGARARELPIPGLDEVAWLDNRRILELRELPEHLVVIGGGYIGLEFGQMFHRFGSRVTVIERSARVMSQEDDDVGAAVQQILTEEGIAFETEADVARVAPDGDGVAVTITRNGSETTIRGSHLLVAAGRVPNTERLDLDAAGIETDERGFVRVGDDLRTTAEHVFALGDVNGESAFTHTAVNDAEIVLSVLGGGERRLSDRIPVYAMFTDPPLGRVGLNERQALEQGYNVLRATQPMASISRAKEMGETKGFVKLLVDGDTDLILGASILGASGDEVINMFAAFMYSGLPCELYRKAVLVHPTVSELMPWILDGLEPAAAEEGAAAD